MASGHVLTSITKRPAWPNHDFLFIIKRNNFEIATSCFDKFCVGNSTLKLIAALCGPLYVTHNPVYVTFTTTLHRTTCERTDFHDVHITRQAKERFSQETCSGTHFIFTTFFSYFLSWKRNQVWLLVLSLPNFSLVMQTCSLHSCNDLSVSLLQDLADKALYPNLIPRIVK